MGHKRAWMRSQPFDTGRNWILTICFTRYWANLRRNSMTRWRRPVTFENRCNGCRLNRSRTFSRKDSTPANRRLTIATLQSAHEDRSTRIRRKLLLPSGQVGRKSHLDHSSRGAAAAIDLVEHDDNEII